jgi:bacillithiol system protein YtxJ
MNWTELTDKEQVNSIVEESNTNAVVIFKHSTRCGTSSMVKMRLERDQPPAGTKFYYLDLIRYREVSNYIAEKFNVHHESPQVLVIKNGECTYDESHNGIMMDEIAEQVA